MTLWWARKEQLDRHQLTLIEDLPLQESHLILGPPGSGKTNVLLRRAQFVRSQDMPNVQVLSFTRPLTEFVKTGCYDSAGREIFPKGLVNTIESWIRGLYKEHDAELPDDPGNLEAWKSTLASGAMSFSPNERLPPYDALFVDEAQDLMQEEVELMVRWSPVLFLVGDNRQKIYSHSKGLESISKFISDEHIHILPFHYRLAPEICQMADRILVENKVKLEVNALYDGPKPGRISAHGPLDENSQLLRATERLADQTRVYGDLLAQGDKLGIIVARQSDRDSVLEFLESKPDFRGKGQIIRARSGDENDDYDPTFDPNKPISIVTVHGCKGLEFRSVHWLFSEKLKHRLDREHYYTVVTRAKTSLDLYYSVELPEVLSKAYAPPTKELW